MAGSSTGTAKRQLSTTNNLLLSTDVDGHSVSLKCRNRGRRRVMFNTEACTYYKQFGRRAVGLDMFKQITSAFPSRKNILVISHVVSEYTLGEHLEETL